MSSFISKIIDKISHFPSNITNKKERNDMLSNMSQKIKEIQEKLDNINKTNIQIYKIKKQNIHRNYPYGYDIYNTDSLLDIMMFQSNVSNEMKNLSTTDPDKFSSVCDSVSNISKFYNETSELLCQLAHDLNNIDPFKKLVIPDYYERVSQIKPEINDLYFMIYSLKITAQIYMMCKEFPNDSKIELIESKRVTF